MARVLVTGATGFIASHVILRLLEEGHEVRGTARSADRAAALNAALSAYAGRDIAIEIVPVDLTRDEGWGEAMAGVHYLQHVASPLPTRLPKNHDELIVPAREGALRALRAAKAAGVRRVVMTSSVAAIAYGWGSRRPPVLDESHWSDPDNLADNSAYTRSKTLAERAAWDYVAEQGDGMELACINPVVVLGPAMSADVSASLQVVIQPMRHLLPAYPKLSFGIVDVRDVADAHVRAMTDPAAAGERYLLGDAVLSFREIGDILREAYPDRRLPRGELPDWLVRALAQVNRTLRQVTPELGRSRAFDNGKARALLGRDFIPAREAILASTESLIALGEL
jgi:dihydroflavonol-4-reductase